MSTQNQRDRDFIDYVLECLGNHSGAWIDEIMWYAEEEGYIDPPDDPENHVEARSWKP